jgi:hypothetical protein
MNCPECGQRMTGGSVPYVTDIGTHKSDAHLPTGDRRVVVGKMPSSHYVCENCDTEWVRNGRTPKLRKLDGADSGVLQTDDYHEESLP